MNILKSTIIWTLIIFIALTFVTMKYESASDGIDTYGFPFIYYDHFEGKCDGCYANFGLKPFNLFVDVVFSMILGFLITILKKKLIK